MTPILVRTRRFVATCVLILAALGAGAGPARAGGLLGGVLDIVEDVVGGLLGDGTHVILQSPPGGLPLERLLQLPEVLLEGLLVVDVLPERGAALLRVPLGVDLGGVLDRLNRNGALQAFPNAAARPAASGAVLDPSVGGIEAAVARLVAMGDAWSAHPTTDDVRIAMLDTGIAWRGRDRLSTFGPKVRFASAYDALDPDGDGSDTNQHGTYLASVAAGALRGAVTLLPVRVLDANGDGHEFAVVKGLFHAIESGADVINLSLSFGPEYTPSDLMVQALLAAEEAGVVVVAATGNEGEDAVGYPAAFPTVIAVGATDGRGQPTAYGNAGPAVDVVAPGGGDDAARDGVAAMAFRLNRPRDEALVRMAGTSTSAAVVSAVVALIRAQNPALGSSDVRALLRATARDVGVRGFDPLTGAGLVDAGRASLAARSAAQSARGWGARATRGFAVSASVGAFIEGVLRADGALAQRPIALVEVVDADRRPLKRATVHVALLGSARASLRCVTDGTGRCLMEGPLVEDTWGKPLLYALRVDRVVLGAHRVATPQPAVWMQAERIGEVVRKQGPETSLVVAGFDGGSAGPASLLAGRRLGRSFVARSMGHRHLGSELVFLFDPIYAQALARREGVVFVEGGLGLSS